MTNILDLSSNNKFHNLLYVGLGIGIGMIVNSTVNLIKIAYRRRNLDKLNKDLLRCSCCVNKVYCYADDTIVEWIRPHGPIVEASAGMGWLTKKLCDNGIDAIAYDQDKRDDGPYANVLEGRNGTFEHNHHDRTLLLAHAFQAEESVKNYAGNKVIICGYHFQKLMYLGVEERYAEGSNKEYDFRPNVDFMVEQGFALRDEIECIDPGKAGVTQVYRLYVRNDMDDIPIVPIPPSEEE